MKEDQTEFAKSYNCKEHGNIENQVFTIGYFDNNRNYTQNTFCGVCHFNMLAKYCESVTEIEVERPAAKEKSRIITR